MPTLGDFTRPVKHMNRVRVSELRYDAVMTSTRPSPAASPNGQAGDPPSGERQGPLPGSDGLAPVKSAARVLDILDDLVAHGPGSLQQLASRLAIPKSSLHALLKTMLGRGWIETDATGTIYSLGIRSLIVSSAYLDEDRVVARTSSILDELAQATGEAVHLGRLEGSEIVYTAKRDSIHPLRMYSAVGRRLPAYSTAMGRAILAEQPREKVSELVPQSLRQITPKSTTDRTTLLAVVEEARTRGYAIEHEESCVGISCFGIALPFTQPAVDAISIAVPDIRLDDTMVTLIVESLLDVRRRIEEQAR